MIDKCKILYFSLEFTFHDSLDSIVSYLPNEFLKITIKEGNIDNIFVVFVLDGRNVSISVSHAWEFKVLERFVVI
jgi:hypothetical protein